MVVGARRLRRELVQERDEATTGHLHDGSAVLPDAVRVRPLTVQRITLILVNVVHPETRREGLSEDPNSLSRLEAGFEGGRCLFVVPDLPGRDDTAKDLIQPGNEWAWRHDEQATWIRLKSGVSNVVQCPASRRARVRWIRASDAMIARRERRDGGPLQRSQDHRLPLDANRALGAVHVHRRAVAVATRAHLQVDVKPPALIVWSVPPETGERTGEYPISVLEHLKVPCGGPSIDLERCGLQYRSCGHSFVRSVHRQKKLR